MTEKELKEVIEAHKLWWKDCKVGMRANLSDVDLKDATLSGVFLSSADLCCADMSNADLRFINLSGADLSGANLSNANLWGANLSNANLYGADLGGAYLGGANLSGANLSDVKGLMDAGDYMAEHFEKTTDGYIVYKTIGSDAYPKRWKLEPGSVLDEICNPDRWTEHGCGINVAPQAWVRENEHGAIYKLLIRWMWLPSVVVPYNTDGRIRCAKAEIIGVENF